MEQYLTVKQFADQAGVSTQRIYQLLTKSLQPFCKCDGGIKYLSVEGLRLFNKENLQEIANEKTSDLQGVANFENELLKETIAALKQQLTVKDEQLSTRDKQITDLTAALVSAQEQHKALTDALAAAQALHAGTIQERLTVAEQPNADEVTVPVDAEPQEPVQKKRGFFARIFGKK